MLERPRVVLCNVQQRVANLLRGKVVVGHALKNDFKALQIKHPRHETRDTATYGPLRIKTKSRALKELAAEHLGLEIQHGQHSPVEVPSKLTPPSDSHYSEAV